MTKWILRKDAHDDLTYHAYSEEQLYSVMNGAKYTSIYHAAAFHVQMLSLKHQKEIEDIIETGGTPVLKLTVDAE